MFTDLTHCFIFYASINLFHKTSIEYNLESDLGIIWLYFEKDFLLLLLLAYRAGVQDYYTLDILGCAKLYASQLYNLWGECQRKAN